MPDSNPQLGLVSNCWQNQLARGDSLDDLIAEAARRGYGAVELRQGCLGEYEIGEPRLPQPDKLAKLARRFPQMRLSIAVELPYMQGAVEPNDPTFAVARQGAESLGGKHPAHLRLVDLKTEATAPAADSIDSVGSALATLARMMAEVGGFLSIENARQPWEKLWSVVQSARRQLTDKRSTLKLCFDPVNLLLSGEPIDPAGVTTSLAAEDISMVHFKQRCDGRIATAVCDGDIDWHAQLEALRKIGYRGPYLFEVASHKKFWEYIAGSHEYLRRHGLNVATLGIE